MPLPDLADTAVMEEVAVEGEVPHIIHTLRLGSGPNLVLLHGFAAAVGHWAWCVPPPWPPSLASLPGLPPWPPSLASLPGLPPSYPSRVPALQQPG